MKDIKTKIYLCLIIIVLSGYYSLAQKPTLKVKASATSIQTGDSVVISWASNGCISVQQKGSNENQPLEGSITVKPDTTTKYSFIATAKKETKRSSVTVQVNNPIINKFEYDGPVTDENSFLLIWNVAEAKMVSIPGYFDSLPAKGDTLLHISDTTAFQLVAINSFGKKVTKGIVVKPKYIEDFTNFIQCKSGVDTAKIRWKFKNTDYVFFQSKKMVKYKAIDTLLYKPFKDSTFIICAVRCNGDTVKHECKVNALQSKIEYVTAPYSVLKNEIANVSWKITFADSVVISEIDNKGKVIEDGFSQTIRHRSFGNFSSKITEDISYKIQSYLFGTVTDESIAKIKLFERTFVKDTINYTILGKGQTLMFEIFQTDFTKYPNEAKLYVVVVDTAGHFICNLAPPFGSDATANSFFKKITENYSGGKSTQIKDFKVTEVHEKTAKPRDINITYDQSGSMEGMLTTLEKACNTFPKKMIETDRLSVVRFADSMKTDIKHMSDKAKILEARPFHYKNDVGSSTSLYAAMDEGLETLSDTVQDKSQYVFTDGYDNTSFFYIGKRAVFGQQVAKKAKKRNIKINVVTTGNDVNETLLKFITAITGGSYYNLTRINKSANLLNEISYLTHNYYVITYRPTESDGMRKIALTYNNNRGGTDVTKRETFVGDNFNLNSLESDTANNYWNMPKQNKNKTLNPISLPQSIANFDFNKDKLRVIDYSKIDFFVDFLKKNPESIVTLYGHTDLKGTKNENLELAQKRAEKVKLYLIKKGIDAIRITTIALGKKRPKNIYEDSEIKAMENRRVEALIYQ